MKKNFTLKEILDRQFFYPGATNVMLNPDTSEVHIHVEITRHLTQREHIELMNLQAPLLTQEARARAAREWEAALKTPTHFTIDFTIKAADIKARIEPVIQRDKKST